MKHKKEWEGERLFDSLYEAIRTFLLANAIRDIRDVDKNTHRSMLINMSRFGGKEDTKFGLMEKQIPLTHTKAQDYLIKGRNPLFMLS